MTTKEQTNNKTKPSTNPKILRKETVNKTIAKLGKEYDRFKITTVRQMSEIHKLNVLNNAILYMENNEESL